MFRRRFFARSSCVEHGLWLRVTRYVPALDNIINPAVQSRWLPQRGRTFRFLVRFRQR